MKQIYGIVLIQVSFYYACLAMPPNSKTLKTDVQETITESNGTKAELKLTVKPENKENTIMKAEVAETSSSGPDNSINQPDKINNMEYARNVDVLKSSDESFKYNESLKLQNTKEENVKLKNSPQSIAPQEIHRQSEVWKDFAEDISLLEDRLPDLTDEEYDQINKDGAIPWNFLKSLDVKRYNGEPRPVKAFTPIFITVPIVINTHPALPISVIIGGKKISLNLSSETKPSTVLVPDNVKTAAGSSIVTPTSSFNKLMDYSEPPIRQTNRHRSNFRKKINARNNVHQVEVFECKN